MPTATPSQGPSAATHTARSSWCRELDQRVGRGELRMTPSRPMAYDRRSAGPSPAHGGQSMRELPTIDEPVAILDLSRGAIEQLTNEVRELAAQRNAVVLAHNYQVAEIQDLADFVGDSLALSRQAAATDAELIVFCGVHFMAETASILAPDKRVLIPDLDA